MKKNMLSGKTESGFDFTIDRDVLNKWSTMKLIRETDKNAAAVVDLISLILGDAQEEKLIEHLGGDPTTEQMNAEVVEIFNLIRKDAELKK